MDPWVPPKGDAMQEAMHKLAAGPFAVPNLVEQIVSVQPMTMAHAEIFLMKYHRYGWDRLIGPVFDLISGFISRHTHNRWVFERIGWHVLLYRMGSKSDPWKRDCWGGRTI